MCGEAECGEKEDLNEVLLGRVENGELTTEQVLARLPAYTVTRGPSDAAAMMTPTDLRFGLGLYRLVGIGGIGLDLPDANARVPIRGDQKVGRR